MIMVELAIHTNNDNNHDNNMILIIATRRILVNIFIS